MENIYDTHYDAIVVGAGHAGVEACLALARLGHKTLVITLSLDAIAFMACNPAIGGTAKGHLVREIDALGGQMGISADHNLLQIRMLNGGKGEAVRSLRGQADKSKYHLYNKSVLENTPNLTVLQGEVKQILTDSDNQVCGVETMLGQKFECGAVVIATGVYLNSDIIIGEFRQNVGPNNFASATALSDSLLALGLPLRRFKTGTPARIDKNSIDFSKMEIQNGEENIYPFSFLTKGFLTNTHPCYLTYTTQKTKDVILANIDRSPLYNGSIKSIGPRYCPSLEDKIMRFADKERHQIFIEPESADTNEMYAQGMSSSMPFDVQLQMYHSVLGLENCRIMRFAYAIEYDCIDSLCLNNALMTKSVKGLFLAGQINGSSGYEEAAAQGLVAGINASRMLTGKPFVTLGRDTSYIGVLIDDLVTKGTNEPYRMMTARAEYRLNLRQENADDRLTPLGREIGLVTDERWQVYQDKLSAMATANKALDERVKPSEFANFFNSIGEPIPDNGLTFREMLRRPTISPEQLRASFEQLSSLNPRALAEVSTLLKYDGYIKKQNADISDFNDMERILIPDSFDYLSQKGIRLEAKQKLDKIRPTNVGQASRISGVSPADIVVLMICLENYK
ncbi:MAG: tRNA uridine-5-carboxymethylaminomethyl(34) synthesis enzyme MnmG [Clostridia bacterium]